jgi:hypothetical protein
MLCQVCVNERIIESSIPISDLLLDLAKGGIVLPRELLNNLAYFTSFRLQISLRQLRKEGKEGKEGLGVLDCTIWPQRIDQCRDFQMSKAFINETFIYFIVHINYRLI